MANVSFQLGDVKLTSLDAGEFLFDGGAMFGAVPKVIWETLVPVDEFNRIRLTLSPLLISVGSKRILVDVGFGTRHTKKDLKIYGFDPARNVVTSLAEEGLAPSDIDIVVLTHLHADHAGGATTIEGGELVPTFPSARYVVNEREWRDALDPDPRSRAAYRRDDFVPLERGGCLALVGDREDLGDGVSVVRTGGHTAGHMMVLVQNDAGTVVYPADIVPSRHHVRVPYIAGVDLFPLDVIEEKEKLLSAAAEEKWIVVLDHDPEGNVGRIVRDEKGRYAFSDLAA